MVPRHEIRQRNQDGSVIAPRFGGSLERGVRAACDILVGDRVETMTGPQVVRWVGRRRIAREALLAEETLRPVRISAGALGRGLPVADLWVSRQHRIFCDAPLVQEMFGSASALVAAIRLVGLPGISIDLGIESIDYVHLLFDRHEIVFAEEAPSESLFSGPEAWRALSAEGREEITRLFPGMAEEMQPVSAAMIPERKAQIGFVERLRRGRWLPLGKVA